MANFKPFKVSCCTFQRFSNCKWTAFQSDAPKRHPTCWISIPRFWDLSPKRQNKTKKTQVLNAWIISYNVTAMYRSFWSFLGFISLVFFRGCPPASERLQYRYTAPPGGLPHDYPRWLLERENSQHFRHERKPETLHLSASCPISSLCTTVLFRQSWMCCSISYCFLKKM